MYDYEERLFDRYNGEAQSWEEIEADLYDDLGEDEEMKNTDLYEIVVRSMTSGAILNVIGAYEECEAEKYADEIMDDESVWCEVRRERF